MPTIKNPNGQARLENAGIVAADTWPRAPGNRRNSHFCNRASGDIDGLLEAITRAI